MSVRGGGSRRRGRPPSVWPPPLAHWCRVRKMLLLSTLNFVISSPSGSVSSYHEFMIVFHVVGVAVAGLFSLHFLIFRLRLRCLCIHRSLRHWRPPPHIFYHGLRWAAPTPALAGCSQSLWVGKVGAKDENLIWIFFCRLSRVATFGSLYSDLGECQSLHFLSVWIEIFRIFIWHSKFVLIIQELELHVPPEIECMLLQSVYQ
jgi:hypothetical protein